MNRSDLHKQQPMEKPSAGAGASAPGGGDGELRDNKHEKKKNFFILCIISEIYKKIINLPYVELQKM